MNNKLFYIKGMMAVLLMAAGTATAQVSLDIDAGKRGPSIGELHYGLFFEEINHAGDGGLYAELIQNRSFEDNASSPDKWTAIGGATLILTNSHLLNEAQGNALVLNMKSANDGVRNEGFWGIHAVEGHTYKLSFWARGNDAYHGTLTASLQSSEGGSLGETDIDVDVAGEWTKYTAQITATGTDNAACFALTGSAAGSLVLDMVSLFPPTYKDRDNGCRTDLAEMLAAMKPAFVRFPGGCYVEGNGDAANTNRFEWKKTVGPIEERPGHMNNNWGYRVSDGFGFHEMLQLCEDLGAEPLFVVNIGIGHGWAVDYNNIDEYIQEALDAIEYCNGDAETTQWGKLRAANGHPAPFGLRLMEIGNENYNFSSTDNSDQSDHYAERYEQFRKAIKAKYPYMQLIGNVESWGTDAPSWRNAYAVDLVDEHYYRTPAWFVSQYDKYDSYSRASQQVYVGEYAVTIDYGTNGNLAAALGEAVFMLGMENNSDVCRMNSYAPIFVNENNYNWRPDMIRFNSHTCYGTPSYHVQQLFPNHVGRQNVAWTESGNLTSRQAGLSTWLTCATFDNFQITDSEGNVSFSDDFSSASTRWTSSGGTWAVTDGTLSQSDASMQGNVYLCNTQAGESYTLEVDATKTSGDEGFLIAFNYKDSENYCWWNIGGWGNTKHAVEQCIDGSKSTVASQTGSLVTGQTYHLRIEVCGPRVKCYMDGTLMHDVTLPVYREVYVSSSIDDEAGMLYLKLVNPRGETQQTDITLQHASVSGGKAIVLSSGSNLDENTSENPTLVAPQETTLDVSGQSFSYSVPAYSVNILCLQVTDVELTPDEEASLPSPLIQYSFEGAALADDSARYAAYTQGGAAVVAMQDGNKAVYTGASGQDGYVDLGAQMANEVLAQLTGDYTISVDLALRGVGQLANYCWAVGLANGTEKYLALVNTPNNANWYFTIKDSVSQDAHAGGGLSYGKWHNMAFTQKGTRGYLYVDGRLCDEATISQRPDAMASALTCAYLGRSPFSGDAYLAEAYIDNFRIYDSAIGETEAKALYAETEGRSALSPAAVSEDDRTEVAQFMRKFNYLHASTTLPAETQSGTSVSWTFQPAEEASAYVTFDSTAITVQSLPQDTAALAIGTLSAHFEDSDEAALSCTLRLAPDDDRAGYLYCFMNANEEITNFALGTEADKGRSFNVLLDGAEAFDTYTLAAIEHGTRDAYIGRGEAGDGYFITTTDMRQQTSGVWNNYGMNLLRSGDLIHWRGATFNFTQGKNIFADSESTTDVYATDEAYALINRVWAPQFIWDATANGGTGAYLVYYSLLSSNPGDTYDRICYSYTDADFTTLTQPRLLFDPGFSVIDADIVYNPYDSLYHMYYKREAANGSERGIYEATSKSLVGGDWTDVMHVTNEGTAQVEGSSTVRRINEDAYNLYYMRYSNGSAYKYCQTDHLGLNASGSEALGGTGDFQHGSVMTVTSEEYTLLQSWSDVKSYLPQVEKAHASSGSPILAAAIQQADSALSLTAVPALAESLPAAYAALQQAMEDYKQALCDSVSAGQQADLTFLLQNPDFSLSGGWDGTAPTIREGVGEHYSKTFDTYQVLHNMPAGDYRLTAQGFYRYGSISVAHTAHEGGTERLLAHLYLNDSESSFLSLYDDSAPYAYSPYSYPDDMTSANAAFNANGYYTDNAVTCTLTQQGDLKVGVAKREPQDYDWACFDNFHLYYLGKPDTGIGAAHSATGESETVDVYTTSGIKVRSAARPGEATTGLPHGVYLVGGRKVVIR